MKAAPSDETTTVQILLRRFLIGDSVGTTVKYAPMIDGIALTITGAITTLTGAVIAKFDHVRINVQ